jgi:hypothetical protein
MKLISKFFGLLLLVILFPALSYAQQKPLKGDWLFTIQSSSGSLPVVFKFKKKGKGNFSVPTGTLPLSYRENGPIFSVSGELPENDPLFPKTSLIIRGRKSTDNSITADLIVITPVPTDQNPLGFNSVIVPGAVSGTRQK